MTKLLTVFILGTLIMPAWAVAQIELPELPGVSFDVPEALGQEDVSGLMEQILRIGDSVFALFKSIFSAVVDIVEQATGMSIVEIARGLIEVAVNLLRVIINVVENLATGLS